MINNYESKKYLIDLNKVSLKEKALIFYNHLLYYQLNNDYFNNLLFERNYFTIITHKNYNPRIIEYTCKKYSSILPNEFFINFKQNLDNPKEVWDDEFKNKMKDSDRLLMYLLYSLTDLGIGDNILKEAYYNIISDLRSLDVTVNLFEDNIKKLTNSLLKMTRIKDKTIISVINPSINDYMKVQIENNPGLLKLILIKATYFEQISKFNYNNNFKIQIKKIIIDKIEANTFFNLFSLEKSKEHHILQSFIKYDVFDPKYKKIFNDSFLSILKDLFYPEYLLTNILNSECFNYYSFEEVLKNHNTQYEILMKFDSLSLINILSILFQKNIEDKKIYRKLSLIIKKNIKCWIKHAITDEISDIIIEEISSLSFYMPIYNNLEFEKNLEEKVFEKIIEHINYNMNGIECIPDYFKKLIFFPDVKSKND